MMAFASQNKLVEGADLHKVPLKSFMRHTWGQCQELAFKSQYSIAQGSFSLMSQPQKLPWGS